MTEDEFRSAFDEHKDVVYRFAWRMTNSPAAAEDIAQDVFLLLLRQPERFDRRRGTLRSFLLGVARNVALKKWRDDGRYEELDDDQPSHWTAASGETAEVVGAAVSALPPLQREVLILAEYEGLSLEEIASAVQAEVGTIKARLHRAREKMRHMLAPLMETNRRTSHGTAR